MRIEGEKKRLAGLGLSVFSVLLLFPFVMALHEPDPALFHPLDFLILPSLFLGAFLAGQRLWSSKGSIEITPDFVHVYAMGFSKLWSRPLNGARLYLEQQPSNTTSALYLQWPTALAFCLLCLDDPEEVRDTAGKIALPLEAECVPAGGLEAKKGTALFWGPSFHVQPWTKALSQLFFALALIPMGLRLIQGLEENSVFGFFFGPSMVVLGLALLISLPALWLTGLEMRCDGEVLNIRRSLLGISFGQISMPGRDISIMLSMNKDCMSISLLAQEKSVELRRFSHGPALEEKLNSLLSYFNVSTRKDV